MIETVSYLIPSIIILFLMIGLIDLYILIRKLILLKIKFYTKQIEN